MTVDEFMREWRSDSPCVRVHTSGSTGAPKEMMVEKSRMEASARTTCDFLGLKPDDRALICLDPEYIAGKMMIVRSLVQGLKMLAIEPSGHPLAEIGESVIDFAAMVPMQVFNSLQVPLERERLKKIKHLIIGGGAIDESLEAELRQFPNAIWSTYGMTETLSHIALRCISGKDASEWYTPLRDVKVWTVANGCLAIHAPMVCSETLYTRDLAEIAPDGKRFRIVGRIDNVICSGGIKMQIEDIERRLSAHAAMPYMITSVPDPKFGEAVVMLLVGNVQDARQACELALPKFMRPKHYIAVDELPFTANGKPARALAKQLALSRLA